MDLILSIRINSKQLTSVNLANRRTAVLSSDLVHPLWKKEPGGCSCDVLIPYSAVRFHQPPQGSNQYALLKVWDWSATSWTCLISVASVIVTIQSWQCLIYSDLFPPPLSVVQEAVQFCVTAFEFSVADSVCGVRKMLPLVWSTDATIKDAVIQAYRRLYLNPHGDNTRSANVLVCSFRLKGWNIIYSTFVAQIFLLPSEPKLTL